MENIENESLRPYFGVLMGVVITVISGNMLNTFFGWELAAMAVALIYGMEVGMWYGEPKTALEVHRASFGKILGVFNKRNSVTVGIIFSWLLLFVGLAFVSYFVTHSIESYFGFGWYPSDIEFAISFWSMVSIAGVFWYLSYVNELIINQGSQPISFHGKQMLRLIMYTVPIIVMAKIALIGFVVLLYVGKATFFIWKPILIYGGGSILAAAITFVAFGLIGMALAFIGSFVTLLAHRKTMGIAMGTFVGGAVGLFYGWTNLAFFPTVFAICYGSVIGSAVTFIASSSIALVACNKASMMFENVAFFIFDVVVSVFYEKPREILGLD